MPSKLTNEQRQRLNLQRKEFNETLKKRNNNTRLEYNLEILELLKDFAEQNPELRFSQILSIFFEEIGFYEEPKDTLEKIKKELKK
jgi:hypothetical protein